MIEKLGGRKNIAFYFVMVTLIVFVSLSKLSGGEFITGLGLALAIFTGGNVVSKFK